MTTFSVKTIKPFSINADGDYEIGNIGSGRVGIVTIDFVKVASFDGNITLKGRATGSGAAYAAVPYAKLHLNTATGDGSQASTAITDRSVIQVDGSGMDFCLTCASRTTGSMTVTVNKAQAA